MSEAEPVFTKKSIARQKVEGTIIRQMRHPLLAEVLVMLVFFVSYEISVGLHQQLARLIISSSALLPRDPSPLASVPQISAGSADKPYDYPAPGPYSRMRSPEVHLGPEA